jgi:hypothetical protein
MALLNKLVNRLEREGGIKMNFSCTILGLISLGYINVADLSEK